MKLSLPHPLPKLVKLVKHVRKHLGIVPTNVRLRDLPSNERRRSPSIILIVQVRSSDRSTALTDVVACVADSKGLGGRDGAERLSALRVAEDNNCKGSVNKEVFEQVGHTSSDLCGIGS